MPKRAILVATDGSKDSRAALELAHGLARDTVSTLYVLNVVEAPIEVMRHSRKLVRGELLAEKQLQQRQVDAAERRVRSQLAPFAGSRFRGVLSKVLVRVGRVDSVLLELALALDVDFIVLGKGRRSRELSGTVSVVARASLRPVVIVPTKWQPKLGRRAPSRASELRPVRALRAARARR